MTPTIDSKLTIPIEYPVLIIMHKKPEDVENSMISVFKKLYGWGLGSSGRAPG
jgi:hypothetical protein